MLSCVAVHFVPESEKKKIIKDLINQRQDKECPRCGELELIDFGHAVACAKCTYIIPLNSCDQ